MEPDPRMRAVLAGRGRSAHIVGAVGERLPFGDASLDAVIASSSWHWMDPIVASAEAARVLRVGGVFGLLWSGPDRRVDWVAEVLKRLPATGNGEESGHRFRRTMVLAEGLPFSAPEATVVNFTRQSDAKDLAGLSGTFSVVILGGGAERAARMELVRERARARFGDGRVELPMACRCWRAVRTETHAR